MVLTSVNKWNISPLVQFCPKRSAGQTQSRDPIPLKQICPPLHVLVMLHWSTTVKNKKLQFHDGLVVIDCIVKAYNTVMCHLMDGKDVKVFNKWGCLDFLFRKVIRIKKL